MIIFSILVLTSSAKTQPETSNRECGVGMTIGINEFGEADPNNVDKCYPTPESAFIKSCNNPENNFVEMKVAMTKVSFINFLPILVRVA